MMRPHAETQRLLLPSLNPALVGHSSFSKTAAISLTHCLLLTVLGGPDHLQLVRHTQTWALRDRCDLQLDSKITQDCLKDPTEFFQIGRFLTTIYECSRTAKVSAQIPGPCINNTGGTANRALWEPRDQCWQVIYVTSDDLGLQKGLW